MDEASIKGTLRDLQGRQENRKCVDCGAANPQWATVSFGTFICLECSGRHRALGTHISFVRSVGMDKWKEWEVQRMLHGGNDKFSAYAKQTGIHGRPIQDKYNTKESAVYSAKLKSEATGEPYVAPSDPTTRAVPNSMPKSEWDDWSTGTSQPASSAQGSFSTGFNGYANNTGGKANSGYSSGGISSDMWHQQAGGTSKPVMQGMGYSGSTGRKSSSTSDFGVDQLTAQISRGLTSIHQSEAAAQAAKAASDAAISLKSWFGSVSSSVAQLASGVTTTEAPSHTDMRSALLKNLDRTDNTGQSGMSSDQWRREHAPPSMSSDQYRAMQLEQHQQGSAAMTSLSSDQYRAMQSHNMPTPANAPRPSGGYQQQASDAAWTGFGPTTPSNGSSSDVWGWPDS
uniref:Arf-GAP domain-containing protein n=1 Tax=Compsopogon caeruleus TaxID=31354 RepID=A0A7S1TJD8_9RHOD|mmetsp:Transcript_9489/g.19423  ORF Transcript_9489/g.19423 Transcript_9489/m.19423 type:complete len:399 (+) Transcript_9489:134-1330(+)